MKNNSTNGQITATPRSNAAESPVLTETMKRLRNQTPAESLGQAAGNGLLKPFLQAGAVTLVLLGLLTVVPYFVTPSKNAEAKPGDAVAKQEPTEQPKDQTPPKTDPVAKTPPGKGPNGKADDVLNKLGESGTKTVSPKVNPLDKKDDDILKDLK